MANSALQIFVYILEVSKYLALMGFSTIYKVFYHIGLSIKINIFNNAYNRARHFAQSCDSSIYLRSSQLLSLRVEIRT